MEVEAESWDYFIVLDFEATCDEDKAKQFPQEIIEFPSVVVDIRQKKVIDSFQEYVRPVKKPTLSAFCTKLTGITQEQVDKASAFPEVFKRYQKWLNGVVGGSSYIFITCGDWDLKTMLPSQLKLEGGLKAPSCFSKWINIKDSFTRCTKKNPKGMVGMLNHFKIELKGRHHSGIDDCKNISSVVIKMLELNMPITRTNSGAGNCHTCGSPEHFQYDCPTFLGSNGGQKGMPGDWVCTCGSINFARRTRCYSCDLVRSSEAGSPPVDQSSSGYEAKPGDWDCPCGASNFARRNQCFACNAFKTAGSASSPVQAQSNVGRRQGDWDCTCGTLNFASRDRCYRCSSSKPGTQQQTTQTTQNQAIRRPGDWDCECGSLNFGRRNDCYACRKSRPAHLYGNGRAGDWNCSCGELNFGRNDYCRKCGSAKK